jgi:hypothetical protein
MAAGLQIWGEVALLAETALWVELVLDEVRLLQQIFELAVALGEPLVLDL